MSLYATIQFIRYRLKAKTRHGVHSPFVYGFIEHVLLCKPIPTYPNPATNIVGPVENIDIKHKMMLLLLTRYCEPPTIYVGSINDTNDIAKWMDSRQEDDVICLHGIYDSKAGTAAWQTLCGKKDVKLSIDLYTAGLLFFKKEFKEKQHFVLKY